MSTITTIRKLSVTDISLYHSSQQSGRIDVCMEKEFICFFFYFQTNKQIGVQIGDSKGLHCPFLVFQNETLRVSNSSLTTNEDINKLFISIIQEEISYQLLLQCFSPHL